MYAGYLRVNATPGDRREPDDGVAPTAAAENLFPVADDAASHFPRDARYLVTHRACGDVPRVRGVGLEHGAER